MSTYSSYHSPTSFDTASHAHIPPISAINRQPYDDDSTSLPPMHIGSSTAPPLPSTLIRETHAYHGESSSSSSSTAGHGLSQFVSQQSGFHGGSSMASTQAPLYSSSNYSSVNPLQSYSAISNPSSATHGSVYGQSPLPSVTSALYGTPLEASPLNGYSSAGSVPLRTSHYQHDDVGLDNFAVRRSRRDTGSNNALRNGTSHDGSMAASGALAGAKNAEGKFPCQICNKTYQHQKHLKRHNLRHTGERPYRCHLCHETFCRSDILKRHFAKCSIRRGNPEGITHLTHAQDHLKKPSAESGHSAMDGQSHPSGAISDSGVRAQTSWTNDGAPYAHIGSGGPQTGAGVHTGSNGSSRSSSVIPPGSSGSGADDKRHHSAMSHTLPPIHSSSEAPSGSIGYSYDQHSVYSRNGYGHNDSAGDQGFYQQMPSSSAPFMVQHNNAYSLPSQPGAYHSMSQASAGSNGHWLSESPFHANNHDAIMYSGS